MGDAAHPLRPTGQGFNQAVEDAHGLAAALAVRTAAGSAGGIDCAALQVRVHKSLCVCVCVRVCVCVCLGCHRCVRHMDARRPADTSDACPAPPPTHTHTTQRPRHGQAFCQARARRVAPVAAFSTETGRAAFEVLKNAASEEDAALNSMGWCSQEFTNEAFDRYVYDVTFDPLSGLRGRSRAHA
jgi:hypothetical protein